MSKRRKNALAHLLKHGTSRVGPNLGIDAATAVTLCEDGVAEFAPDGKGGHELRLVKGICIHGCPPENECRFCISDAEEGDDAEESKTVRYHCSNKRCRKYHVEVKGLPPAEIRRLTGRSISCESCGKPLWYLG